MGKKTPKLFLLLSFNEPMAKLRNVIGTGLSVVSSQLGSVAGDQPWIGTLDKLRAARLYTLSDGPRLLFPQIDARSRGTRPVAG